MARRKSLKEEIATRYEEIGIFGPVARGDDDPKSDIDLLVEFGPDEDLITVTGPWQYLEDPFGTKIVSKGGLRSEMRDEVMRDRCTRMKDRLNDILVAPDRIDSYTKEMTNEPFTTDEKK
jgi:predicted nucleotidyltransferase